MYFNKKNSFFHGIMFHHFYDNNLHLKGQGAISKDQFYRIIKFIGIENIVNADLFYEKFKSNKLKNNEVCITFDDAIKCQIDVALPVLEDLRIKSFFFVYSSIFEGKPDLLEIYRYFRLNFFNTVDEFYNQFYLILNKDLEKFFKQNEISINIIKAKRPFYSIEDIKFRLVRNMFLDKEEYEKIMEKLFLEKNFEPSKYFQKLFFNKQDLINLDRLGHIIGLHSHTHPTHLEKLSKDKQNLVYSKCIQILSNILNKPKNELIYMSHPCGSYNNQTLKLLNDMGIKLGFKQVMDIEIEKGMKKVNNSNLEIAREDHANILRRLKE